MNNSSGRPQTLFAVAVASKSDLGNYPSFVKEFLDESRLPGFDYAAAIAECPPILGGIYDAHLAGLAEYIAFAKKIDNPKWVNDKSRFLPEPVFFGGRHSRGIMLATTAFSMRRRNLFCGEIRI